MASISFYLRRRHVRLHEQVVYHIATVPHVRNEGRPGVERTVRGKQKIGLGLLLLWFAIRDHGSLANLYWLEVLAVPIMVLVGLNLIWGLNE